MEDIKVKPEVKVELLEMEDPTFEAGTVKTARARLTNTTIKQFTYTTELYLGVNKASSSGVGNVTIPANSFVDVTFTITMPSTEATYPVFLEVRHEGTLLRLFQATETVITVVSPQIDVGPITWI